MDGREHQERLRSGLLRLGSIPGQEPTSGGRCSTRLGTRSPTRRSGALRAAAAGPISITSGRQNRCAFVSVRQYECSPEHRPVQLDGPSGGRARGRPRRARRPDRHRRLRVSRRFDFSVLRQRSSRWLGPDREEDCSRGAERQAAPSSSRCGPASLNGTLDEGPHKVGASSNRVSTRSSSGQWMTPRLPTP